jgi:hypothetical protein
MKNPTLATIIDQLTTMMSSDTNSLASFTNDADAKKATMKKIKLEQRAYEALVELQKLTEDK